jgi:hypothetical protein
VDENPELAGEDTMDTEPSRVVEDVVPMDEDDDSGQTPHHRHIQKHPIIVFPSEKGNHPARCLKLVDFKVCAHSYLHILH